MAMEERLSPHVKLYSPRNYRKIIEFVHNNGRRVAPRGQETFEMQNVQLLIKNPLDRLIVDASRRMNFGFAVAEFISFFTGEDKIDFFTKHIGNYSLYSTDGVRLDNSYGSRVNGPCGNQILGVIEKLKADPSSRQAVISLYNGSTDLFSDSRHIPCTLCLLFKIREDEGEQKLQMTVVMRSNDIVKGLTFDVFVFSLVQEFIARQLGLPLGKYIHQAESFHLYATDLDLLERNTDKRWPNVMRPMPTSLTMDEIQRAKDAMWVVDADRTTFELSLDNMHEWTKNMVYGARAFVLRTKNPAESNYSYHQINDLTIKRLLRGRLVETGAAKRWGVSDVIE